MSDRQMKRGDSLVLPFQVVRDVTTGVLSTSPQPGIPPPNNVPVDITLYTIWFTAKRHFLDPDSQAIAQLKTPGGTGIVLTQPVSGEATATMPASATINFPDGPDVLNYDIQVKDPAGVLTTVESGTVTVTPDVTRATS